MRPALAVTASAAFLVVVPGTVFGLVPWLIGGWRVQAHPPALPLLQAAGVLMLAAAVLLLLACFGLFSLGGRGTPAPVAPPERLVVRGPYRYVRNPMYVAVLAAVLGEAALFADLRLLAYAALLWLGFDLFVAGYEEPDLRRRFGRDYAAYLAAVPRWLPRLRPWRGAPA
jgi:protein-S-isoprenylcysteine O-methyltransferase Ste14